MKVLGVDPGLDGAYALLDDLQATAETFPLAGGDLHVAAIYRRWRELAPDIIVIERSQAFPTMGRSSAFNYGATWGALRAIAACLGVRVELVGPAKWHKALLVGSGKDRSEIKNAVIRYVYQAFPAAELVLPGCKKPHDGLADALCIAEYGRRTFGSETERQAGSMSERRGDWIQTYPGGRQFWPCDPRPEEVDIEDIAHSLSLQCRYAGHVRTFYSVAEHCVRVSFEVPPVDALAGLLHDAAEAYVIDLPRPLKRSGYLDGYHAIEAGVHRAIAQRFGIPEELPASVKVTDNRLLLTEKRDLTARTDFVWTEAQARDGSARPYPDRIIPWSPRRARQHFLDRFADLKKASAVA